MEAQAIFEVSCQSVVFPLCQIVAKSPGWLFSASAKPVTHCIVAAKLFLKGSPSWNTVLTDSKIKLTAQYRSFDCVQHTRDRTHTPVIYCDKSRILLSDSVIFNSAQIRVVWSDVVFTSIVSEYMNISL